MIKFISVVPASSGSPPEGEYTLAEIWINENYIVSVREAPGYQTLLQEGNLPAGLDLGHGFTAITTNNGNRMESHVVVGSPGTVASRLSESTPGLLKG